MHRSSFSLTFDVSSVYKSSTFLSKTCCMSVKSSARSFMTGLSRPAIRAILLFCPLLFMPVYAVRGRPLSKAALNSQRSPRILSQSESIPL